MDRTAVSEGPAPWRARLGRSFARWLGRRIEVDLSPYRPSLADVRRREKELIGATDARLREAADDLRAQLWGRVNRFVRRRLRRDAG